MFRLSPHVPVTRLRVLLAGLLALALALVAQTALAAPAQALTGVDLSTYKRVGRFDLPEPTRTTPPPGNLLGQEASGVAYNWDTDTLFVVGDGGTSVTQVTKTGGLVDTMTLPPGGSDQGTEFYDTEGIAYLGNNEFVMTEERYRQAVRFTYEAGGTLTRAEAKTVKLGTTIGNVGLEDVTNDPVSGGYIFAKELEPRGIFQTGIDWDKGTATNGGPAVVNSTNLFDPALTGLIDISGVYALANVSTLTGPQTNNLLIISQESGEIVNVDRAGNVSSSLTLVNDPGNPLSIQAQTHEGVTMDSDGVLYSVSESGGGDSDHPQLWVFSPSAAENQAPTQVALSNQTTSLPENTNTATRLKLADVVLSDDGLGTNQYSVTGPDASFFEAESSGLYLKAGTVLNKASKASYDVTVKVEDTTVAGSTPVTTPYTLTVTTAAASTETTLAVTEVAPWGSGDGAYGADWFELTNTGTKTVNLTGWRMDDESASFGSAVTLNGVTTLAPGESAIFTEDDPSTVTADFNNHWFGGSPPAGFKIGSYTDTGTGLSTGGDQVNIFNPSGIRVTGVAFGSSTPRRSFDNTAALGSATSPVPPITTLSSAGTNGAFTVGGETGSPGIAQIPTPVIVSEVAPWGSSDPTYGADWWELTNKSSQTLDLSGWKIDDESNSFGSAIALSGVTSLAPGQSAIFVEGDSSKAAAFKTFWFGSSVPAGFQIGTYSGSGIGLGSGGDQLNVFNDTGTHLTGVKFGSATTNVSFDNAAGLGSFSNSVPTISTLSAEGLNGAFKIHDQIGSPGAVSGPVVPPLPQVKITEVSATSSSNSTYKADFWELTNTGSTTVDLTGWKVDDDSSSFGSAIALTGVSSLAAGESAIFVEGTASTATAFKTHWFGPSPPAGFKIGTYSGSGIGFGNGGDQVNVFDSAGTKVTGVSFGSATTGVSFDNAAGIGGTGSPPPTISTLSVVGTNGAFAAGGEVGSPGTIKNAAVVLPNVKITEVSSTSSSNGTYGADFWELTNNGASAVDLTGWKVDDDSSSFGSAIALSGVTSLAPGESAIFLEGTASTANAFKTAWFGSSVPAGFQIGTYSGSGIGFGSGGDQVNVFNSAGTKVTGVRFGSATTGVSFDNAAGIGSPTETPPPLISTLSVVGTNGAFAAGGEIGSPGTIKNAPAPLPNVKITEVSATSSSNSTYKADFWELTNTGSTTVDLTGWKVDDDSSAFGSALVLNGVSSLAAGESAIFLEGTASTADAFKTHWFGASPPAGFKIGFYSGSGIGFGSGGDQVNVFNAGGTKVTGVRFGSATTGISFDNAAGIGSATESPPPLISTLSVVGTNGAFAAGGEIGSPGTIVQPPAPTEFELTVSINGSGSGTVTSDPTGIGCAPDCVEKFVDGTVVKLSGAPSLGSNAVAWQTCPGTVNGSNECVVTVNAAKAAVATFDLEVELEGECFGTDIVGEGSTLQGPAHDDVWIPGFQGPGGFCAGKGTEPKVSHVASGSGAGLAAWDFNGPDGTPFDTSRAFVSSDEAPTAAQLANAKAASGSDVAVVPVAQTAIGIVVNPPANCEIDEITNKQLESVFRGNVRFWGKLDTAFGPGCAGAPITRVVRPAGSGTTYQFKNYLQAISGAGLACTAPSATWKDLGPSGVDGQPNVNWPESGVGGCSPTQLSPVLRAAGNGGAQLVDTVDATEGSFGYAALPDIEDNRDSGTRTVALQNNGLVKLANATFAVPDLEGVNGANCDGASYDVPAAGRFGTGTGVGVDWSQVFGGNLKSGGELYPLCSLTYDLALTDYSAAGLTAGAEATVGDYLAGYVTAAAGQSAIESAGRWYAPLPTGAAARNVLGAAQLAASKIGF